MKVKFLVEEEVIILRQGVIELVMRLDKLKNTIVILLLGVSIKEIIQFI